MIFNSWAFVGFFLVVYLLYLQFRHRAQNRLLLLASYVFYSYWDYRFLSLLLISTAVDFTAGRIIADAHSSRRRKTFLVLSLVINLGLLAAFKYFGFFVESFASLCSLVGLHPSIPSLRIVLPIGISFYTFQSMSYTIDIYRGRMEPCRNLLDFALYVAFFPQLVAGPIERATHLLGQITSPRAITGDRLRSALWLLLQGYFLKVLVADNASLLVDRAFRAAAPSGFEALIGIYAFALQILADFCGYSRIARGVAGLMGFDLVVNFRQPYFAVNPSDFWKRWHISLSSWLRDYLYIPLGGNRNGQARTLRNLMLTMLLGGLWHGGAWRFVIWGAYHGALLILFRLLGRRDPAPPRLRGLQMIGYFQLTCFGWLIFRCESLEQILTFPAAILRGISIDPDMLGVFLLLAVPTFLLEFYNEMAMQKTWQRWAQRIPLLRVTGQWGFHWAFRTVAVIGMLLLLFLCGHRGGEAFIYFQF